MNISAKRQIPLSFPTIGRKEAEYVMDCIETTWISSVGKYVERFEKAFAEVASTKHAISCSNGTAALHLALLALGVKPGDEVLVPTLTFVACANSVVYCGAKPVFVDVDREIWSIDASQIEAQITERTRGIIAVHLRGHPADMEAIMEIARKHGLFVIEDAAQAHGAQVRRKPVGSIGDIGTFSFFGNKMLTTGEGGMVTTDDDAMAEHIRLLKNQGMTQKRRYWHPVVGYNYRLTNVQAAIGLAQVERLEELLFHHQEIARWYQDELQDVQGLWWQHQRSWARHAWWQFVAVIEDEFGPDRDAVIETLQEGGIDARRLYYPMHTLPPYQENGRNRQYPVADHLSARGICLPTWSGLKRDDVRYICGHLKSCAHFSQVS
jgi:perosamine synthetase